MRDPAGNDAGFAATGPGKNKKGPFRMLGGLTLAGIEALQEIHEETILPRGQNGAPSVNDLVKLPVQEDSCTGRFTRMSKGEDQQAEILAKPDLHDLRGDIAGDIAKVFGQQFETVKYQ
jgi:hypothetical protein